MIKLNTIKLNDGSHGLPKNPRLIKDDKFKSLCESIEINPNYVAVTLQRWVDAAGIKPEKTTP